MGIGKLTQWVAAALASMVFAVGVSTAYAAEEPVNPTLDVNPEANMGLEGWTSTGWAVVAYGSSPNVPPRFSEPGYMGPPNLFQAKIAGSTMTQNVSFARYASQIEAGTEPIAISAVLGSAGSKDDGAELLAQPEDAEGKALGPPTQLGPPTAADRGGQATLIGCRVQLTAPIGTRSVLITLQATGAAGEPSTAMANSIIVSNLLVVDGGGNFEVPAQGQNCYVSRPSSLPPPAQAPAAPLQSSLPGTVKPPNNRQKLTEALAACRKAHHARRRRACVRAAKKRYSPRRKIKADHGHSKAPKGAGQSNVLRSEIYVRDI